MDLPIIDDYPQIVVVNVEAVPILQNSPAQLLFPVIATFFIQCFPNIHVLLNF